MAKKSWSEKFQRPVEVQIEVLDKPFGGVQPGDKMAILTPKRIDAALRALPTGQSGLISNLRESEAKALQVNVVCPLTTGIFLRIVAEVALEQLGAGRSREEVAPFWRWIRPKDPIAKKLSCGPDWIREARLAEGITD